MKLKDEVKEIQEETKEIEQQVNNHSLAWNIIHDLKIENKTIKILLGLSIIANIVIVLLLKD